MKTSEFACGLFNTGDSSIMRAVCRYDSAESKSSLVSTCLAEGLQSRLARTQPVQEVRSSRTNVFMQNSDMTWLTVRLLNSRGGLARGDGRPVDTQGSGALRRWFCRAVFDYFVWRGNLKENFVFGLESESSISLLFFCFLCGAGWREDVCFNG